MQGDFKYYEKQEGGFKLPPSSPEQVASSPVAVGVSSQLAQVPKQADELSWLPFTASTSSIMSPCKMMHMENVKDNGKKRRLKYQNDTTNRAIEYSILVSSKASSNNT